MSLDFESIEKWQDLFSKYTLGEVRALRNELHNRAHSKKQELRTLIGSRYPDLIEIAGQIIKMETVVNDEDERLASLCSSRESASGTGRGQCFSAKLEKYSLANIQQLARERLLKSLNLSLRYEINSRSDWPLLGRTLLLAECLNGDVKRQRQQLEKVVRQVILDGAMKETDNVLGALICYMILTKKDPSATLSDLVSARPRAVSRIISQQTTESLVQSLRLCSSSLQLVETAFSRNKLHRLVMQQTETFMLLGSPDIAESSILNIDKYQKWLPESVKSYPSFPPECTNSIQNTKGRPTEESQKLYTSQYSELTKSLVLLLSEAVHGILEKVISLSDLVELLRHILELFRDTENLRQLHDTKHTEKSWLTFVFIPTWIKRGKEILKSGIERVADLHGLVEKQVENAGKSTVISRTDSVFSPTSVLGMARLSLSDLESVFDTLDSAVEGKVGAVRPVTTELDNWKESVEKSRDSIEDTIKLKTVVSSSDNYDIEEWRVEVEKCIEEAYKELKQQELHILSEIRKKMVNSLLKIAEQKQNTPVYVLLVRTQLYMDRLIVSLAPESVAPEKSQQLLDKCYLGIAKEFSNGLERIYLASINTRTWVDQLPVTPSLDILGSLTKLVQKIVDLMETDDLVLAYTAGVSVLRSEIANAYFRAIEEEKATLVAENPQVVSQQDGGPPAEEDGAERNINLQLAMDTVFVSKLFNVECPPQAHGLDLQSMTQHAEETATKTRLLYYPFSGRRRPIHTS